MEEMWASEMDEYRKAHHIDRSDKTSQRANLSFLGKNIKGDAIVNSILPQKVWLITILTHQKAILSELIRWLYLNDTHVT